MTELAQGSKTARNCSSDMSRCTKVTIDEDTKIPHRADRINRMKAWVQFPSHLP